MTGTKKCELILDNPHFLSSDVSSPFNSFASLIAGSKDKSEETAEDTS